MERQERCKEKRDEEKKKRGVRTKVAARERRIKPDGSIGDQRTTEETHRRSRPAERNREAAKQRKTERERCMWKERKEADEKRGMQPSSARAGQLRKLRVCKVCHFDVSLLSSSSVFSHGFLFCPSLLFISLTVSLLQQCLGVLRLVHGSYGYRVAELANVQAQPQLFWRWCGVCFCPTTGLHFSHFGPSPSRQKCGLS